MMRIAVTGASGFIGTELLGALSEREDIESVVLSRDVSSPEDIKGCIWRSTDYSVESLREVLFDTDAVIHLAGVRGTEDDARKFAVNAMMTEHILQAMAFTGTRRIIFASSMSVYGEDAAMPYIEDGSLGAGRSAYGTSKLMSEYAIFRYSAVYDFKYAIARIAQVIGEGEKRRGMMNAFLDAASEQGTLKVLGRSIKKKHYIYVKDLTQILLLLAVGNDRFTTDESIVVNAGMPRAYTSLEVAQIVNEVFGNKTPIEYDDSYPETGRAFDMDVGRLRNELGYSALDMKEAITDYRERMRER